MYFHISDLIPIAILIGSAALCLLGFLKAKKLPPRIICALTGLVFLAGIPGMYLVRNSGMKHDYTSKHGIRVKQGQLNKCMKDDVEQWTEEIIVFWSKHYPEKRVKAAVDDKFLACLDDEKLTIWGQYVRGYNRRTAVIGWSKSIGKPYAKSLFRHEISHHILAVNGVFWNEELHHKVFKEKGLEGATGSARD